jgi:hypothetical protein
VERRRRQPDAAWRPVQRGGMQTARAACTPSWRPSSNAPERRFALTAPRLGRDRATPTTATRGDEVGCFALLVPSDAKKPKRKRNESKGRKKRDPAQARSKASPSRSSSSSSSSSRSSSSSSSKQQAASSRQAAARQCTCPRSVAQSHRFKIQPFPFPAISVSCSLVSERARGPGNAACLLAHLLRCTSPRATSGHESRYISCGSARCPLRQKSKTCHAQRPAVTIRFLTLFLLLMWRWTSCQPPLCHRPACTACTRAPYFVPTEALRQTNF